MVRVAIAAGGGYAAVVWFHGGSMVLFAVLAAALMVYGLLNAVAVASGVWFHHRVPVRLMPQSLQAAPAAPDP